MSALGAAHMGGEAGIEAAARRGRERLRQRAALEQAAATATLNPRPPWTCREWSARSSVLLLKFRRWAVTSPGGVFGDCSEDICLEFCLGFGLVWVRVMDYGCYVCSC